MFSFLMPTSVLTGNSRVALVPELSHHHHVLGGQNARILGRQRWQAEKDIQGELNILLNAHGAISDASFVAAESLCTLNFIMHTLPNMPGVCTTDNLCSVSCKQRMRTL